VSSGKANVLVGILRLSPGTESVTELTSRRESRADQVMAALRLPLTMAVSGIERPRRGEFKATAPGRCGFFYGTDPAI